VPSFGVVPTLITSIAIVYTSFEVFSEFCPGLDSKSTL
jgi:hypothetical protein